MSFAWDSKQRERLEDPEKEYRRLLRLKERYPNSVSAEKLHQAHRRAMAAGADSGFLVLPKTSRPYDKEYYENMQIFDPRSPYRE